MADFRRLLYAFAIVALLVGLIVPASAIPTRPQSSNPLIREFTNDMSQLRSTNFGSVVGQYEVNWAESNHDTEFGPGGLHVGYTGDSIVMGIFPNGKPWARDLLFPWVVTDSTFTTSIVIANTSLDPCGGQPLISCIGVPHVPQDVPTFSTNEGDNQLVQQYQPEVDREKKAHLYLKV